MDIQPIDISRMHDKVYSMLYSVCAMTGRDAGAITDAIKALADATKLDAITIAVDVRIHISREYQEKKLPGSY